MFKLNLPAHVFSILNVFLFMPCVLSHILIVFAVFFFYAFRKSYSSMNRDNPLYEQKLTLTSPTSCGRPFCALRSRTKATVLLLVIQQYEFSYPPAQLNACCVFLNFFFRRHWQEKLLKIPTACAESFSLLYVPNSTVKCSYNYTRLV
jgi:hypothetical protein